MFETKNPFYYIFGFSVIMVTSYFVNKFKEKMQKHDDEYDLIKKYLLNDSPLYGYNKPKIWIHTKYEVNSRNWKSFYSRNSTDLNQPYIHLTVKSIIDHCGDDFNVCLIDDDTFSKLIPSWDIDLNTVAEPMRSRLRTLGFLQLIYYYGGMVVPNSFLCLKNLKSFYNDGIRDNKPFVCESINNHVNLSNDKSNLLFIPDVKIMGSPKNNDIIKDFIEYLKEKNRCHIFSSEFDLLGETQYWCLNNIRNQKMNLINGNLIGIKNTFNKPILIDDLLGESFLDLSNDAFGIYIPEDDILKRTKYQWFAVMKSDQLLNTNLIITKYIKSSIVDSHDIYNKSSIIPSAVAI